MSKKAYYSNKSYARKAMAILVNKMVMFETVEERENEQRPLGEWELGVKFYASGQGWVTIFPADQSDLGEIRELVS